MLYTDVLGTAYKIEKLPPEQMEGDTGNMELSKARITIDNTTEEQRVEETLVHEVVHCIETSLGLNMKESQVTALAEVLYSLGFRVKTYEKEE